MFSIEQYPPIYEPPYVQIGNPAQNLQDQFNKYNSLSKSLWFELSGTGSIDSKDMKAPLLSCMQKLASLKRVFIGFNSAYLKPAFLKVLFDLIEETCPQLTIFQFTSQRSYLNKAIIDTIFGRLKNFNQLEKVQILLSSFSTTLPKIIGIHLQSIKNLKILEIILNDIQPKNSVELFTELQQINTIEVIKIQYQQSILTLEGSKALGRMILNLKELKSLHLNLEKAQLSKKTLDEIGISIGQSKKLREIYLNFSNNDLSEDSLFELGKQLKQMDQLYECQIILNFSFLDQKTINALSESFQNMTQLTKFVFQNKKRFFQSILQNPQSNLQEMRQFNNIIKSMRNLLILDIQIDQNSFIPILQNLKFCQHLRDLVFSISLETAAQTNYSKTQLKVALQNLENIPKIKIIFQSGQNQVDLQLGDIVASSISNLHKTTDLSLDFTECFNYIPSIDIISQIQKKCIEALLCLKDSVNHVSLQFSRLDNMIQILEQFSQFDCLYSLKILQGSFFVVYDNQCVIHKKNIILKFPKLVNYKLQIL